MTLARTPDDQLVLTAEQQARLVRDLPQLGQDPGRTYRLGIMGGMGRVGRNG